MKGLLLVVACSLWLGSHAVGQCLNEWAPGGGVPGVASSVPHLPARVTASIVWDPDGSGPQAPGLVVGGVFSLAGGAIAERVAFRDANGSWSALGGGAPGAVNCFAPGVNDVLLMGGSFFFSSGAGFTGLAAFQGGWGGPGAYQGGVVEALLQLPNGSVVTGGASIGVYNGFTWQPLGSGITGTVKALARLPNGDIVAGGTFTQAGGAAAANIARWNGSSWSPLGSGTSGPVASLLALGNGDLVVGGTFATAGGVPVNHLARWNGSWTALGGGTNGSVNAVTELANGDLLATGTFTLAGSTPANAIARFDGTSWSTLGAGLQTNGTVTAEGVTLGRMPNGDVLVGGTFQTAGGVPASNLAAWNGTTWSPLVGGSDDSVLALLRTRRGELLAGGSFRVLQGDVAAGIARRTATGWQPLGSGIGGSGVVAVRALAEAGNGDLLAGGSFAAAGGVAAANIARWNGAAWAPLGAGIAGEVRAIVTPANQDVIAAGSFASAGGIAAANIARWNGTNWAPLGAGMDGAVNALALLPNGDVVAAGAFNMAGGTFAGRVARWDGTTWQAMGFGLPNLEAWCLLSTPSGQLFAGGSFGSTPGQSPLREWNGTSWLSVPSTPLNTIRALLQLPDGDLVIATAGFSNVVQRRNGSSWSPLTSYSYGPSDRSVYALANSDAGLAVGGLFWQLNGAVSAQFAELRSTCAPTTTVLGPGCPSTGGSTSLAVATPAWLGGTWRTFATGIPPIALVGAVYGLGPTALPLATILPAGPTCTLWAAPDLVNFGIATLGTFEAQLVVPELPALLGAQIHHQCVPFAFTAGGALIDVGASNALSTTLGRL